MDITLTHSSIAAIIGAMLVLAIIPDTSAIAVVARSISSGFIHGLVTIIGIVVGALYLFYWRFMAYQQLLKQWGISLF